MSKDNDKNKKQKQLGDTDIEFSEDIVDIHEKEMEVQSKEQRKGIQSIPFYRNG